MMEMERRCEQKRMNIEKRVALFVPGKDIAYPGMSSDMSDAGLCADFQRLPKYGEDVILQVFWQEDMPPIEQPASLVWQMRSSADGTVRAGLKMKDMPTGQTPEVLSKKSERSKGKSHKMPSSAAGSLPLIELGADIRLLKGGMAIDTKVASIGDFCEDNTVQIVLEIQDSAFGCDASIDAPLSAGLFEQDCMNHPIRDTWRALKSFFFSVYHRLSSLKSP